MLRKYFSRMVVCVLLVCAVACSGSWTALASPEAVAVWNGDFSPNVHTNDNGYALSDVATYTYTGYGDDEYKSVTIKGDDIGLLCNFPNKMSQFTVLVKYSGLETSDSYTRTIFATTARADYNLDKCGIRMLTNGTVIGLWNDSPKVDNDADFGTPSEASVPASGIFAVTYHGSPGVSSGVSFYAASDDPPLDYAEIWRESELYSGAMWGFAVGGHCIGSRNLSAKSVQAAKGMTITGLAVFTNVLTVAEMSEYLWPTNTSTIDAGNETTDEPEVPDDPQDPDAPQDPNDPQDPDDPQEPLEPGEAERVPVAVWNEDFSPSARTKFPGFTLVDDQQTHGENGSSVVIDQDNQGLLVDFDEKHGSFTVLVKYSNLVANDLLHRVVFATTAYTDHMYDSVGIRLTGDGSLTGLKNMDIKHERGDYDDVYSEGVTGSQKFYTNGTLAVIYDMSDKGGLYVYAASTDGVFPSEEAWGAPDITRGCMTGFSVGGMCRGAGNMLGVEAAKGMTITGLAVFTNALTVAEMNAFDWRETTPSATDTEFPAPYFWIDMYFPDLVSGWSSAQYNDFATNKNHSSVKNGYAPWESYVLGLDPTNEISKLKVLIRMDGERPVVEYSPTNEELKASGDIKYVLQGKPTLNNDWQDVDFNEPGDTNHFFRVKVIW